MTTFNYEINIEATTEAEADAKMKAITVLVKKLKSRGTNGFQLQRCTIMPFHV